MFLARPQGIDEDPWRAISIAAILLAIFAGGIVHEYGHAWVALRRGDDTAQRAGRLTLFPLVHVDLFNTLVLPVITALLWFPFGGMRPVPVSKAALRNPERDMVLVALAGPAFQLLFCAAVMVIAVVLTPVLDGGSLAIQFLTIAFVINAYIACFNLIPIPPLDGSRVLRYFLPDEGKRLFDRMDSWGLMLVLVFLWLGGAKIIRPVASAVQDVWFEVLAAVR